MNIKRLLKLQLGEAVSVFNDPFTYVGQAKIQLDSGHTLRWLYDDEEQLLSVDPKDDELILFEELEDELEPEDEIIVFQGKEYEFDYEDAGNVLETEGESDAEEDTRFLFSDYQAQGGEIIRLIENENTGETNVYMGRYVSEEDIIEM